VAEQVSDDQSAGLEARQNRFKAHVPGTDSARFSGMFVTLGLVTSVVAPVFAVIAALLRAPEAYENEQGLQIIQKRSLQVKHVASTKKVSRSFYLIPEPTGLEPATSAVTGRRSNQLS
jgi:hypothetical protein